MNIACISTSRIPSDTANSIQVMKACHGLAQLGHNVLLLLPAVKGAPAAWDGLDEQYGLSSRFEIRWIPCAPALKRNDFAWSAVRQAVRRDSRWPGADLVYTWTGQSAVFGLLHNLPVMFEVHDLPTGRLGPLWFRAFLRLRGKKRLLPITRALQYKLEAGFGKFPEGLTVISPNAVDLEAYAGSPSAQAARKQLDLPEAVTVMCAGHLYAGRGADLFLGLAERFPQASFVWVGGRPADVETWKTKSAQARLENITFTGFVSQRRLPCYQAAADILLMPYARSIAGSSGGNSAEICSPMKMFDYMAAGRAIVSSDLPVIREVLDERTAVFAPPEDVDGWAKALDRLFNDPHLREDMAEQARVAAQEHTWRARAERALAGF